MIWLRTPDINDEYPPIRNGINIWYKDHRSSGFILRIGRFYWRLRWSKYRKMWFKEVGFVDGNA